jgi:hypothetical protein
MKSNIKLLAVAMLAMFVMSGCASMYPIGMAYTEAKIPALMGSGSDVAYSKVGVSKATSILSLVATGDASVEAAVKNGNIKTIKYVDWNAKNILGIYGEYTTTVYGD